MSILAAILDPPRPRAAWAETDDRWFVRDPSGFIAPANGGFVVSASTALRCTTVLAAVRFRALALAQCPPQAFRRSERGREEMPNHYAQRVLRHPNAWQTAALWQAMIGLRASIFGNAYCEIVGGPRSFAEELRPLSPLYTEVADQRSDGTLVYVVREPGKPERRLGGESVMHVRELTEDGFRGVETYRLIHQAVCIALLAEQHGQTFLRKGARVAGLLVPTTGALTPDQRKELRDSVNSELGGISKTGTLGVLPHGVELKQLASSNRDGQVIELDDHAVGSILRGLGVPGVAVGWSGDKASTYASAKEFYESGGIRHCIQPLVVAVEQEATRVLLPRDSGIFVKYNLDALIRGNLKDRYEALYRAVGGPWLAVNEAREVEDWNPHPDKRHDQILTPGNMSPELLSQDPAPQPRPRRAEPDDDDAEARKGGRVLATALPAQVVTATHGAWIPEKLRLLAEDAAERIVAWEEKKLAGIDPRNVDALRARVAEVFGVRHVEAVARALRVPTESARAYVAVRGMDLLQGKSVAREVVVADLVALALAKPAMEGGD